MNDVLDWVLYARDEVQNVTTVYVNQYLKAHRVLDPGRLPTATTPLRNNIMPLYEAKNPTFLRRFTDFDRTSETAENAKIGL